MKYGRIIFLFLILGCSESSVDPKNVDVLQTPRLFSELLERVSDLDSSARVRLVNLYLDSLKKTPIIEKEGAVFFVYQGSETSVKIAGDFSGWNPQGQDFDRIENTQLWYKQFHFEPNARLDYKLVLDNSRWILDPKNPNIIPGGFGPNSELAMPGYEQPWEIVENENVAKGTIEDITLESNIMHKSYYISVYLPPGYDPAIEYPVAYFQDGAEYLSLAYSKTVLDNLIAKNELQPLIGVFVVPNERNEEYAFGERFNYRDFFVNELVPFIDRNYSTISEASSRAVIGDSYGGNISAIIAFSNPEVFGNCGIHSGAFQANGFSTNSLVMDGIKKEIVVASIWGSYEGASLTSNMHVVKDYLLEHGYKVHWNEYPEGHSWGLWRATLDEILIYFYPK